MSRWLRNVNALLENLDSTVEETVEEHRFNRTLTEAARVGDNGGTDAAAKAVEGLLQEEAQGVDDILAKRGLLGSADEGEEEEEEDDLADDGNILDDTIDDAPGDNENGNAAAEEGDALNEMAEGAATDAESELQSEKRITPGAGDKNDFEGKGLSGVEGGLTEGSEGVVDESAFEEINFGGDSGTDDDGKGDERQKDPQEAAQAMTARPAAQLRPQIRQAGNRGPASGPRPCGVADGAGPIAAQAGEGGGGLVPQGRGRGIVGVARAIYAADEGNK